MQKKFMKTSIFYETVGNLGKIGSLSFFSSDISRMQNCHVVFLENCPIFHRAEKNLNQSLGLLIFRRERYFRPFFQPRENCDTVQRLVEKIRLRLLSNPLSALRKEGTQVFLKIGPFKADFSAKIFLEEGQGPNEICGPCPLCVMTVSCRGIRGRS